MLNKASAKLGKSSNINYRANYRASYQAHARNSSAASSQQKTKAFIAKLFPLLQLQLQHSQLKHLRLQHSQLQLCGGV